MTAIGSGSRRRRHNAAVRPNHGVRQLRGKGVVVTGAGRGIGRAIAARVAAEGARVVVNDLDADAAAAVAAAIGGHAIGGDAGSEAGVSSLIGGAREHLGRIDIYFANAGVESGGGLETSEADWASSMEINLMAHVRAARELVPLWVEEGGGRLVVTASTAGLLTLLGSPAYSASKHAAVAFAEWLSASYRHRGVIVQAICPQAVNTRMLDPSTPTGRLVAHDGSSNRRRSRRRW